MKTYQAALRYAAVMAATLGGTFILPAPQAQAIPVFDITNYAQNVLQAARALEQINNQIKSLQNEASMLQNMATNLAKVDFPQLQEITSAMDRINQLMGEAQALGFKVNGLDEKIRTLYPGELQQALSSNEQAAAARGRLDAAEASYRQAMQVQAGVAENVREDAGILGQLASTSQNAVGALQVSQAANQLLALSIKQQFQLQNLVSSEFRDEATERARRVQAEEEGRAATRRFLDGSGRGGPRN